LAAVSSLHELLDARGMVVRHHLCEEELAVKMAVAEIVHLRFGIRMRVGPSAKRERRHVRANRLAKLPGMRDATGRPDRSIAAKDDKRRKSLLPRTLRIPEAELERMLGREKRHHVIARHVGAEVDHQMPQVVLLARADRAVGEEHK